MWKIFKRKRVSSYEFEALRKTQADLLAMLKQANERCLAAESEAHTARQSNLRLRKRVERIERSMGLQEERGPAAEAEEPAESRKARGEWEIDDLAIVHGREVRLVEFHKYPNQSQHVLVRNIEPHEDAHRADDDDVSDIRNERFFCPVTDLQAPCPRLCARD